MKMIKEHFEQLQSMVTSQLQRLGSLEPYLVSYQQSGGDWKKRFRWDILYTIPYELRQDWFNAVYQYANDDHIDTALRKIMKDYM
jgi:hypothetical protein